MSFAGNGRNMYNRTNFIAILQQAIKKPLVTVLLPRTSYARGWRCESNYDQFFTVGQVTHPFYSIARQDHDGERRWLPCQQTQIKKKAYLQQPCFGVAMFPFPFNLGTNTGCLRAWQPVSTEMKNARYWQYLAFDNFSSNCIFAELPALAAPSVRSPLIGEGDFVSTAVLSGRRITQTKLTVKKSREVLGRDGAFNNLTAVELWETSQ